MIHRPAAMLPILVALFAGCTGDIGDGSETDGPDSTSNPPGGPHADSMLSARRLTKTQLQNSLADVFGVDPAAFDDVAEVATDPALFGEFTNEAARREGFVESDIEALFYASYAALEPTFSDPATRASLLGCEPTSASDGCVRTFIERTARLLFRRTPSEEEVNRYLEVAALAAADNEGQIWTGIANAAAALIQSPSFLYAPEDGATRYAAPVMAARIALAISNAGPDEELLDAADAGDLDAPEGIAAQARRLLSTPNGERGIIQGFFREYLHFDRLEGLGKDGGAFPGWTSSLASKMRTEVELLLQDLVFVRKAPFESVLTQHDTFVDAELAAAYGIDGVPDGSDFTKVTIPSSWERVGLLGTGAFLALNAHTLDPSPTLRGRFIRTMLMCDDIPPPPPTVSTDLPGFDPSQPTTQRERLENAHASSNACSGCHSQMDPLGFPFGHFDAAGAYQQTEHGLEIDSSGAVDDMATVGAPAFAAALAENGDVKQCIAVQLFRYAAARRETSEERDEIRAVASKSTRVTDLIVELVSSEPFRTIPTVD